MGCANWCCAIVYSKFEGVNVNCFSKDAFDKTVLIENY